MRLCSSGTHDNPGILSYPIGALLPQSHAMALLDNILEVNENAMIVELVVREDGLFSRPDRTVPAWVGLEYMAQAIAAYCGYQKKCRGEEIELGFLLGTRHYKSSVDHFCCGMQLKVRAEKIIDAPNEMMVFSCSITGEGVEAHSTINVLVPQNSKKFLAEKGI